MPLETVARKARKARERRAVTSFPRYSSLPRKGTPARDRFRAVAAKYLGLTPTSQSAATVAVTGAPSGRTPSRRVVLVPARINPRDARTWPRYVRDHARAVRVAIGEAAAIAEVGVELAWLERARPAGWALVEPTLAGDAVHSDELGPEVRHWPAGPRYAVAALERSGVSRAEAVARVRGRG